jgi:iron complex outermembrane receptor protein
MVGFPASLVLARGNAATTSVACIAGGDCHAGGRDEERRLGLARCMLIACLALVLSAGSVRAAEQRYDINIPALRADASLKALAQQTNAQLLFPYDLVKKIQASPVSGRYTLNEALEILLRNTGLSSSTTKSGVITISAATATAQQNGDQGMNGTRHLSLIAAIGTVLWGSANAARADQAEAIKDNNLDEIVVTAEKKSERLQDVPVPVTVLDAETLIQHNESRIQDYFATVPGLSVNVGSFGNSGTQALAIRGVTTSADTSPTVGVTIDDVPFGSSSVLANGAFYAPDLDPGDLSRIEVLRGPQGTLYGASSIGGLIKFVTADPSTAGVSGRVQMLGEDVEHGEWGYGFRGAVNVPLSDTFAIRVSGFTRFDPGYIDNVTTGQQNVNDARVYGGLFSSLWQPSTSVSLKFSALLQNTYGYGSPGVDATNVDGILQPTIGDLLQSRLRGSDDYDIEIRLYTMRLNAKLGSLDFASITGYGVDRYDTYNDLSRNYSYFTEPLFDVTGTRCSCYNETEKFSQEFRLSSASGQPIEWLAGAFYTHEYSPSDQVALAINSATGAVAGTVENPTGVVENFDFPTTLTEYAVFGDLTVHFTDRLDVQFGGRESEDRQAYNETDSGPTTADFDNGESSPFVNPTERTKENEFTYLLTPRFRISSDLMVYARFSSGYRVGGPNFNAVVGDIPAQYAPDKTYNYEIGTKGAFLDNAVTFDASVYYIDWKRIQLSLTNPITGFDYNANAGDAKSQGLELSAQARPINGMTISAAFSFDDAVLTQGFPQTAAAVGSSGDRLPFSSRYSGNLAVNQDLAVTDRWTTFVGGSVVYVGARNGEFVSSYTPQQSRVIFPSYAAADLRAGARYDDWTISLFANNIFDKRGGIGGGLSGAESKYDVIYIQPLTVGLNLLRKF